MLNYRIPCPYCSAEQYISLTGEDLYEDKIIYCVNTLTPNFCGRAFTVFYAPHSITIGKISTEEEALS